MLGKEVIQELRGDGNTQERERNLMNADRVRTRPKDNAIFLTSNHEPILLETQRWFQNKKFSKLAEQRFRGGIRRRELELLEKLIIQQ